MKTVPKLFSIFVLKFSIPKIFRMSKEERHFHSIGESIDQSEKGKLFGKLCYKIGGKAFICYFEEEMVFKLSGDMHEHALGLSGSQLFDPSKKKRPMKEWVQVSFKHQEKWLNFAQEAANYVSSLLKK